MGSGASKSPTGSGGKNSNQVEEKEPIKVDNRLPLSFRELYTLKNYWKTIRRQESNNNLCSKSLFYKYLKANPDVKLRYSRLTNVVIESPECSDPTFTQYATNYLKVFDDVISMVEENPEDANPACDLLKKQGKIHRKVANMKFDDFQLLENSFLDMVKETLEDRFNEKSETLFRKFFQFCLRFILEGFNS